MIRKAAAIPIYYSSMIIVTIIGAIIFFPCFIFTSIPEQFLRSFPKKYSWPHEPNFRLGSAIPGLLPRHNPMFGRLLWQSQLCLPHSIPETNFSINPRKMNIERADAIKNFLIPSKKQSLPALPLSFPPHIPDCFSAHTPQGSSPCKSGNNSRHSKNQAGIRFHPLLKSSRPDCCQ